ncbi:MAG: DUF3244 domain-containing protein [Candidatus Paraprevotella stercoravium]|uniref:DUF3244 domain-containing protein n=1 Tax=Candidatus Paraprevotella stercoravium TaxID=2838725 RepID=A0A9E2P131_9BACT|nr:DUF3244 domain-containing protein [Candidatus Paraprevotella stercoravium]
MKNLYSRLAALLLCVFVSLSAWADDKDNKSTSTVLLNKKAATTLGKDKRSVSIEPRAQYDASTLYLSAPLSLENVEVMLRNADGNILFADVVTLSPTVYLIDLEGYGEQSFEVEIYIDESIYYGDFSL